MLGRSPTAPRRAGDAARALPSRIERAGPSARPGWASVTQPRADATECTGFLRGSSANPGRGTTQAGRTCVLFCICLCAPGAHVAARRMRV
eukprot:7376746-Prymnesium_polylepis.1